MKKMVMVWLCCSRLLAAEPVVLSVDMTPVAPADVAKLSLLGPKSSLEEANAQLGLSVRPVKSGKFDDYQWLFEKGETAQFRLQFEGQPASVRGVVTLWDWHGRPVYSESFTTFPIDAVLETRLDAYGIWMITFDAYGDDRESSLQSRLVRSFGAVPDAKGRRDTWKQVNGYLLGSCFFPQRYHRWGADYSWSGGPLPELTAEEGIEKLLDLAARCGFTVLRTESYNYDPKQPTWKPAWDFFATIADQMAKHELAVDLKYAVGPECFIGDTLDPNPPVMNAWKDDLDDFIQTFVLPGKVNIAAIEIGNEPAHHEFWSGTREQYQYLLKYAVDRLRRAKPDLLLLHGGTCQAGADLSGERKSDPAGYEIKRQAQEEWYAAFNRDLAGVTPVWAYHFHGAITPEKLAWREWETEMIQQHSGGTSVMIQTEGGSSAWRPDLEVTSWAEVLQKVHISMANREKGWIQYDLALRSGPSRYAESNGWALIDAHTFSPKFQYGAFAAMVNLLADCTFEKILFEEDALTAPCMIVQYKHLDGKVLVYLSVGGELSRKISSNARSITSVDSMGNHMSETRGGSITVAMDTFPRYLFLSGATSCSVD